MFLLISTFTNTHFSVAVGEKSIARFKIVKKEYSQSALLLKTIHQLLANQRINKSTHSTLSTSLRAIFVVQGPGAFSALRIGIATANALAFALQIPVVGIKLEQEWLALTEEERLEKVWSAAVKLLDNLPAQAGQTTGKPDNQFVSPFYGMEPHITMKKDKKIKK
ncbi:MAG: hypothetical protein V1763_02445 [Parcubacteria group bacterium]